MTADRSVFVYDSMDEPLQWLVDRGVKVTLGAPEFSTGIARPKIPEDDLIDAARGHAALLGASGARVTRRVIEALPDLRYISKLGIGYEVIDVEAATQHGIQVTNTPVHSEVALVAEHTLALVLALVKRMNVYARDWVRDGRWKAPENMSGTLHGATVGIVGYGQIGRAVASRLQGWGVRLLVHDVQPMDDPTVTFTDLERLLREADVVTLHRPGLATGERPVLDAERLQLLKPTAIVVNTARGALIDMPALTELLAQRRIAGAGIDVYNPEPPEPDDPLLALPNTLLTPHAAAWHAPLRREMALMAFENLITMFDGQTPESLVNPEVMEVLR